jgi:hypothetical protein
MGLSLGGSMGGTSSSSTGSSTTNNTYSPDQAKLQSTTGSTLQNDLAAANGGVLSPGTQAMETQASDQINKTAKAGLDQTDQALAARGFGKSGQTGQATLQSELARESAQGNNAASFAGQQQQINSTNLLTALNYAFTSLGSSASGSSSGKGSSWGIGGGVAAAVPGF